MWKFQRVICSAMIIDFIKIDVNVMKYQSPKPMNVLADLDK